MVTHHSRNWISYERYAKDLIALKRFDEAEKIIVRGINVSNSPILKKLKENLKNDLLNFENLKTTRLILNTSNLSLSKILLKKNTLMIINIILASSYDARIIKKNQFEN